MDRIDSLVEHCNSLNVDNKSVEGEFAVLDVLNYGQTLIDCIDMLGKIYSDSWNKRIQMKFLLNQEKTEKEMMKNILNI